MISANALALVALSGIMGAPHCLIMCGGISSSFAMNAKGEPIRSVLAYNAGRITTYSLTGLFMGLVGSFINVAGDFVGVQSIASFVGGAFILIWTYWRYTLPIPHHFIPGSRKMNARISVLRQKYELTGVFLTGIMLGFLPCGLTYAMQMNAAASGSWFDGWVIMLVFGISTMPILLLVALFAGSIRKKWRKGMRNAGASLAYLMGFLSIMKGLAANGWVPSIHPWIW
ncbi:sulfite exporter TauE/SafE family protein [Cohnella abietis]|uniref:Cytochrome biogenesis protein n=1 Tax=Cohnella abietis TaxID=2507935 RepID=A0A3T1D7V7_9BACL|nr:sulfite exporter TauE/SafE family protein [Cohnella abietis]BBI34166.1 cytochrome biogenesis protein [Cohnella abietis]